MSVRGQDILGRENYPGSMQGIYGKSIPGDLEEHQGGQYDWNRIRKVRILRDEVKEKRRSIM